MFNTRRKKRILIVDDERGVLDMMDSLLSSAHEVVLCESGFEALDVLRNGFQADLVFLDIKMPGLDGMRTLAELQKIDRSLNAVMMTGCALDEKLEEAEKLGAVTHILKPFDIDLILRLVEKYERGGGNG